MVIDKIEGGIRVVDTVIYPVKKTSKVTLTDEVGEFQAGGTAISWKGEIRPGRPNFVDEPINGAGEPIANTFLHCATKVVDINPSTNNTSVVYTLKGGVATRSYPFGVTVPQDNGVAQYHITVIFVLEQ
jgi:hypothetical protein